MKNRLVKMLVLAVGVTLLFSVVSMGYSCSYEAPDGWKVVLNNTDIITALCAAVNPDDDDIAEVDGSTIIFKGGKTGKITVKVYGFWDNHEVDWVRLLEWNKVLKDTTISRDSYPTEPYEPGATGEYFWSSFTFKPIDYQDANFEKRMELKPQIDGLTKKQVGKFYLKFKKAWF